MTIEERATVFADKGLPNNIEGAIRYTYIYAANEQHKIDIEKACQWLLREYAYNGSMAVIDEKLIEDFRKAMEEE